MFFGKPHIEYDHTVVFEFLVTSPYIHFVKKAATKTGKTKFKRKEKIKDVIAKTNGKITSRLTKRFLAINFLILTIIGPFNCFLFNLCSKNLFWSY